MDEILDCYYGGLPETAGGFITEITGGMLADIIMNLHVDGSDEQGQEMLGGYDTDKLENASGAGAKGAGAKGVTKDGDDSDDELIILNGAADVTGGEVGNDGAGADDDKNLIDSDDENIIDDEQTVKGGGNVLMILVELIPTVFPKSYM